VTTLRACSGLPVRLRLGGACVKPAPSRRVAARAVFAAVMAVLGVSCATLASSQGREPNPSEANVKSARMTGTIAGSAVTLDAHIWVNLMPSPESRATPVRIAAKLLIPGGTHKGEIAVSRIWLVPSNEEPVEASIVSSQVTQEGIRFTGTVALSQAQAASGWVVAEVGNSAGSLFIRSPETSIQRVH
jgi:hypothetical protein